MADPTLIPFPATIPRIVDGSPADAATTNQPIDALAQGLYSIKQLLESIEPGQLLLDVDVVLQAGMPVGTPVYLDAVSNVAKPAQSQLTSSTDVGGPPDAPARVYGILLGKSTDTLGVVATFGLINAITLGQWAAVIDNATATPGSYFLSTSTPGKLTLHPGALGVYVGQLQSDGAFMLRATVPEAGTHQHYIFELLGDPAGTVIDPGVGDPQVINTPNPADPGWLPATATYFPPSQIPAGAVFGYNLAHASAAGLRSVFPPLPLAGADFEQGGAVLNSSKVTVNQFGIWWMTDEYGTAPWPVDYAVTDEAEPITFWFSRVRTSTDGGLVVSLENDPSTLLTIQLLGLSGQPAKDGILRMLVSQILAQTTAADEGVLGVKNIVGAGFSRGPVVTRLLPGPGISIVGANGDASAGYYGPVTLQASQSDALQGLCTTVNLQNANEIFPNEVPVTGFPPGRNVAPVFTLEVSRLAPATASLVPRIWLYSSLTGVVPPNVNVSYRVIPPASTPTAIPTGWTSLVSLSGQSLLANAMSSLALPAIPSVPQGAMVLLQVTRQGASDGFTGTIGLARVGFTLQ